MPTSCCATGCTNNNLKQECRDKKISFHLFPLKKPKVVQEWLANIKRENFRITKSTRICSEHFEESCVMYESFTNRRLLKPAAVPTIFNHNAKESSEKEKDNSHPPPASTKNKRRKSNSRSTRRKRKSLKAKIVPTAQPVKGKDATLKTSGIKDEPMRCDSDSDPEILEVKKPAVSSIDFSSVKVKEEPPDSGVKKENDDDSSPPEQEIGRRPSRRAAQLAAKKISDTVRQYSLSVPDDSSRSQSVVKSQNVSRVQPIIKAAALPKAPTVPKAPTPPKTTAPPKAPPAPKVQTKKMRDQKGWHAIRAPMPDIDLHMECYEELLSTAQKSAIRKIEQERDAISNTLKILKADNTVKITYASADDLYSDSEKSSNPGSPIPTSPIVLNPPVIIPVSKNCTSSTRANIITLTPAVISTANPSPVIPIRLSAVSPSLLGATSVKPNSPLGVVAIPSSIIG